MSDSNTPAAAAPAAIPVAVLSAIDMIEGVVAMVAAGRLTGLSTSVQGFIHTSDQEADAKLSALKEALDAGETSNIYVREAVTVLENIAKATGFVLPTEAEVFAHLKGAIDELFDIVSEQPAAA